MVIGGWKLTGKITGLGIMILGLVLLLSALMIYNKAFEDPKRWYSDFSACFKADSVRRV